LYAVLFQDDFNVYESQSRGDKSNVENLTTLPQPGQNIFALGSNEQLLVGTLTSVGEAGGTGNPTTVALALVKRADSLQKQMKELDLEIPRDAKTFLDSDVASGSGMVQPPPMDPLDGLEVVVEGTFTVGILRSVPSRRLRRNSNMFDDSIKVEGLPDMDLRLEANTAIGTSSSDGDLDDQATLEQIQAEAAKAAAEAEAAAAEAKRKAEKMEMLKKRAEEAMAKRKQKKIE
jgi:hypothetical protein